MIKKLMQLFELALSGENLNQYFKIIGFGANGVVLRPLNEEMCKRKRIE